MDADTREPLAGVEVGSQKIGWVTTDNDGRYVTRALSDGLHQIEIRGYYIASSPAPGVTVSVTGAPVAGVDFRVRLEGDIAGQVLDDTGRPLPGVTVVALTRSLVRELVGFETQEFGGLYFPRGGLSMVTDSQGRYHLHHLPAGRPIFLLAYVRRIFPQPVADASGSNGVRTSDFAATYYPSASTIDQATGVVTHSFDRRTGVDIRLRRAPMRCISGTLSEHGAPGPMQFVLREDEVDRADFQGGKLVYDNITGTSGPDGKVRLCGLPAGRYRLLATARLPSNNDRVLRREISDVGSTSFVVADRDLDGINVDARPYKEIAGEIVLDEAIPGSRPVPITNVQTWPQSLRFARTRPGAAAFTLTVQANVHYSLLLETPPPLPYYVRDITYTGSTGTRSLLSGAFEAADADVSPRLLITMGTDAGRVRVRVLAKDATPVANTWVLLLPAFANTEPELAAWAVAGVADHLGEFQAQKLRPGDYWVIATDDPPPSTVRQPQDTINLDKSPELLGALMKARSRGQRITIAPEATTQVIATLTGWR
jgi:hypothetical protein